MMARRSILLFIDSLMNGGAQRQIIVLANALHARGYRVQLLTYYPGDQLSQFLSSRDITIHLIPRNSRFDTGYLFRLYRFLRTQQPDCIISFLSTPNFWARLAGRLARIPRIITSERNINLSHRPSAARLERLLAPLSNAIVVNSHEGQRRLVALGIRPETLSVIYNGVDFDHFSRKTVDAIAQQRRELGISDNEFLILLPGRMERQKNHLLLVQAALRLINNNIPIKVAFAGNEFSAEIKQHLGHLINNSRANCRFLFLGPRSEMALLYSAADVVVLPSLWEGFPNVIVEAMACGTAVIASDISDNSIIVEDGLTGYLFESNNVDALCDRLQTFLDLSVEQRRQMGEKAVQHVRSLCSTSELGNRYVALIENHLSGAATAVRTSHWR